MVSDLWQSRRLKPFWLGIACLTLLQAPASTTNVTETQTIEEGGNVNLTCGDRNLSSSSVLSWSKDGEDVLVNITSHNQSMLVLSNLEGNGSGLYLCTANLSVVLRRIRLTVLMREVTPVQEEEVTPEERLTRVDIIAIVIGLGLTTFLVVSILLLLYRAGKHRKEAKHGNRWQVNIKRHENVAEEEEFTRIPQRSAFFIRTGQEPNRLPPPYRKPRNYVTDNSEIKYEVDENANEDNNDGILQWRFTAYL